MACSAGRSCKNNYGCQHKRESGKGCFEVVLGRSGGNSSSEEDLRVDRCVPGGAHSSNGQGATCLARLVLWLCMPCSNTWAKSSNGVPSDSAKLFPCRLGEVTLKDFKAAIDREGTHRYHFKALDPEFGTVKEEVSVEYSCQLLCIQCYHATLETVGTSLLN